MKTIVSIINACTLATLLASATAAGQNTTPGDRIDFKNDLIPIFTKHGCNAGTCHGAAIGRGGFKLSLYGSDAAADYQAIVQRAAGRRVNLADPEESLLLLKPSGLVKHGGKMIFDDGDEAAQLLLEWIRQGARIESDRQLTGVELIPKKHIAKSVGESVKLKAIAHYSDGSSRDVTNWTVFKAEDASAVEVNSHSAESKVLRRGRHIIVARYLSEVVPVEMLVPLTDSKVDLADEARTNFIDAEILETLAVLRLPVSPTVGDLTFLRRATLDFTGRLPALDRVQAFLAGSNPDKRAALIDDLMRSREFTEYWTLQFAKLLRIRPLPDNGTGANVYHRWLADRVQDDTSLRQLARTLILATGDTYQHGPANFYRTTSGPPEQAEFVSELFMGSRLRCANCHNHPLDHWTQDDYHGLAAIFAKIELGRIVKNKPNGEVIHPRSLEPATQRIPGERFLAEEAVDGRKQLADWLTDSSNQYFAKAMVNRMWKRLMGRGLVEPVDDFRSTNPATHPVLLDKLADDFIANGYSLRHTLRVIATSAAYARSVNATAENQADDRFYSHALRRPLEPEVLADAISDVLGIADKFGSEPEGTRAVALVNPKTPSRTLDILGRCGRDESCESSLPVIGGLAQKLHLFNGPLLNARIAAEGSRLNRLLSCGKEPMEIVNEFYLVALNRRPSSQEAAHWTAQLQSSTSAERRLFLEDFVWGLVTSNEFVTNH